MMTSAYFSGHRISSGLHFFASKLSVFLIESVATTLLLSASVYDVSRDEPERRH